MATSRDAPRSPALAAQGGAAFLDLGSAPELEDVEEVDVDDDVSAADLTGEALLPTGEVPMDDGARLDPEHTAPRAIYPQPNAPVLPEGQTLNEEPLWEPTAPQLAGPPPPSLGDHRPGPTRPEAVGRPSGDLGPGGASPFGRKEGSIREHARLAAGAFASPSLADDDRTGETPLPAEAATTGEPLGPAETSAGEIEIGDTSDAIESAEPVEPLTPLTPISLLDGTQAPALAEDVVLSGTLAAIPIIDVLGLLSRQRQTGVLTVLGDGRRIDITLQDGQVAQATGLGFRELRLGRFVVEMEAAAASEIDELASVPTTLEPSRAPLGARLCQLGYISRDDLRHALSRQSQELIYEALRLRAGRFTFSQPALLPRLAVDHAMGADLHIDLEAMLLEGYRRIHDWHLLERELDEGAVYMRADERAGGGERVGLTRDEQQVLALCTGRNAIGDIARDSRLGKLDVVRIIQRLQAVNLVRRRLPPQAV
jgi:hypothetical protein